MWTSRAHTQDNGPLRDGPRHHGHAHFWERAMSRGTFIKVAAGAGGVALGASLDVTPARAWPVQPVQGFPTPIPGGVTPPISGAPFIHHYPPPLLGSTIAHDPSQISDFNGLVGVADVAGQGTDGNGNSLNFEADMRFMQGDYIAVDKKTYHATFSFV